MIRLITICFIATGSLLIATNCDARTYSAAMKVRVGQHVIEAGDTRDKVRDAGEPDNVISIKNEFGIEVAQEWQYQRGRSMTAIRINCAGTVDVVLDVID